MVGLAAPQATLLEREFAALVGTKYCIGVNSCGSTMFLALKAQGVGPGDLVWCHVLKN